MLLSSVLLIAAAASATPVELHVILDQGESIDDTLRVDGRDACRLKLEHDPANGIRLGCRFDVAPDASIELDGEAWKVLDFGAAMHDNLPERRLLVDPLSTGSRLLLSLDPVELEIRRVGPHSSPPATGATAAF